MKHLIQNALVVVLGLGLMSCEWSGSGDNNSWNDSTSIANFSGNYQGNGGYLVSDYTSSSGGGTTGSTTVISGGFIPPIETKAPSTFSGSSISFTTLNVPIKPGSITVFFEDGSKGSMTDNGSGSLSGTYLNAIPGSHAANGTVVYENGQISIFFPDILGLQNASIKIRYTVSSGSSTTTSTGSSSGSAAGSSGVSIYAFNVQQSGNKLKIIDNNGSIYEGNFGDVKTTGNLNANSTDSTFVNGDQVIAPFSASGSSGSGMHVNMAGNFQGTVQGVAVTTTTSGSAATKHTSFSLSSRVILGTWIEDGGKTGDIKGISPSSASVTVTSNTTTNGL
ncbi:MAG: hypothetical protein WCO42_03630 [bacterium]